jgi:radical SAM protein with 4Fe4S-binding SPASM domain
MVGLKALQAAGGASRATLRGTFTPETAASMVHSLKWLNYLVLMGCGGHVSLESAFLSEGQCLRDHQDAARWSITEEQAAVLSEDYLKAADWMIEEYRAGRRPSFHNLEAVLRRLLYREPALTECGAGRAYVTCAWDGTLYACHRLSATEIGSIGGGIDEFKRAPWVDHRLYGRHKCPACALRYVCGGGCRERSLAEGDIDEPVPVECALRFIWTKDAAHILAEVPGDILREAVPPKVRPAPMQQQQEPPG